jgi:hypothetical protein
MALESHDSGSKETLEYHEVMRPWPGAVRVRKVFLASVRTKQGRMRRGTSANNPGAVSGKGSRSTNFPFITVTANSGQSTPLCFKPKPTHQRPNLPATLNHPRH